jgi:hypothetical protein
MKHAQYRNLSELIKLKADTYQINIELGQVINKETGKTIGTMQQGKFQMIVAFYYKGDTYKFYLKDVIAVAAGWDIRGKTVSHLDQNPRNNRLDNLFIKGNHTI